MRAAALMVIAALMAASCGKVENSMQSINPEYVARTFFETWKKRDWRALYRMTHPAFMQKLRMQKLAPADRTLDDETLFVREFEKVQRSLPGMTLRTYAIRSISEYHSGDTTVWVDALVNGRKFVIEKDVEDMAYPVLRHRIILSFKAEREGKSTDDVIRELLK